MQFTDSIDCSGTVRSKERHVERLLRVIRILPAQRENRLQRLIQLALDVALKVLGDQLRGEMEVEIADRVVTVSRWGACRHGR